MTAPPDLAALVKRLQRMGTGTLSLTSDKTNALWREAADALEACARDAAQYRAGLAAYATLARRMMEMHPGCAFCMSASDPVADYKFCPECGWQRLPEAAIDRAQGEP